MPRQARLDAPGTLHHVMIRGIDGVNIFRDDEDREHFLTRLGELTKATGTRIVAWALMDNHVHLLVFSGPSGLPKYMRRLLTGYAVWFNRRHRRIGHLFQNRYKSIVCEEDGYLLELVRYIHLNPLRSHGVESLEELDKYPWSGHGVLVGRVGRGWQERQYVLSQFGQTEKESIRAYLKFLQEGAPFGRRPELIGGGLVRSLGGWSKVLTLRSRGEEVAYESRILGSGEFVEGVMREAEETVARQMRNRRQTGSITEIIVRKCRELGIREEELKSGSQRRSVSRARSEIASFLSREMGISMAEIARTLGVGASAIAMAMKRKSSADGP